MILDDLAVAEGQDRTPGREEVRMGAPIRAAEVAKELGLPS
jgi:hypothetical protein